MQQYVWHVKSFVNGIKFGSENKIATFEKMLSSIVKCLLDVIYIQIESLDISGAF